MTARIGLLTVELYIGGCRSLKEKRQVLQSLTTRLRNDFNLSIAEVGHQDLHQRACLAIACVGNQSDFVNRVLDTVQERLATEGRITVLETYLEII